MKKGFHHSERSKQKMREKQIGERNSFYGHHHSIEYIQKMKGNNYAGNEEKSAHWKGDDAGCAAIHLWARKKKPKAIKCELEISKKCINITGEKKPLELTNLSINHEVKRDITIFVWACRSCHWTFDKKHLNFKGKNAN